MIASFKDNTIHYKIGDYELTGDNLNSGLTQGQYIYLYIKRVMVDGPYINL